MQLTLNIIRCVFFGWTLLLALHIPGAKRDKRLHGVEQHRNGHSYRKADKLWEVKGKVSEAISNGNALDLGGALDYDLIEVFRKDAGISSEDDFGFTTFPGRQCPAQCVRGLSGLCICPPVAPHDTTATTSNNLTASHPPTPPSVSGRQQNQLVHLHTDIIRQNVHLTPHLPHKRRRFKRDDEDEEDQKLCKCRRCTKLFKRTLYCRVFPCYQKKCKSGEWREPHH